MGRLFLACLLNVSLVRSTARRWCPQPTAVSQLLCIPFQDDTDINIDCATEEKHPNKRVCNVSYPFFRAKAKVMQSP